MRFVRRVLKMLFLTCISGGFCAVASAQTNAILADPPKYVVGDTWKFRKIEQPANNMSIQVQKITALEDENLAWMFLENITTGYKVWWLFDSHKVANVNTFAFDASKSNFVGRKLTVNDQDSRIQFPVFKGKKYRITEFWNEKKTGKTEYEIRVVGTETLKTEAGEFITWKFIADGVWENKINSTIGETKGEMWYSPEVKRWIKTKFVGTSKGLQPSVTTFELIEWTKG